jgi:glutamine amidotransferase
MAVAIIDSGGANIASLRCALARLGCEADLTRDETDIRAASHVLLPGVGAAADAMQRLREAGLERVIPDLKQPVLGICLGMQLLFAESEEGQAGCLGIIEDRVKEMQPGRNRPIPHMGWNRVRTVQDSPLFDAIEQETHFYFVHSFAAGSGESTLATSCYGEEFSAAVSCGNFFGTQFHPERSGSAGSRLLKNFLELAS